MMAYKIGYVDENEGWKSTFYHAFKNDFDLELFDLNQETTAEGLVEEIFAKRLDLLVIDFLLDETGDLDFNADEIVERIQAKNLYYPIIILTSNETDAIDHIENVNLINGKDMLSGEAGDKGTKVPVLIHKFTKIIEGYRAKVENSEKELEGLEHKRKEKRLSPEDEDRYVDLSQYLDNVAAPRGRISRTFYTEDTNERLDQLIKKTQEMIDLVEKEKK
jgi:hypothetical protein